MNAFLHIQGLRNSAILSKLNFTLNSVKYQNQKLMLLKVIWFLASLLSVKFYFFQNAVSSPTKLMV